MAATPCPDLEPLLERFADGECASDDSLRVREHLAACPPCRRALRAITDLNRRVAQSPTPPTPPDLEARLRQAIRADGRRRRFRAWIPAAAAAAALIATAAFLFRPTAGSPPPLVVGGAYFHAHYLAGAFMALPGGSRDMRGYFLSTLKTDVVLPEYDAGACMGKGCTGTCPCAGVPESVPWILYFRGGTAVSLILAPGGSGPLPERARRSRDGHDYHVFDVRGATVLVRAAGDRNCVWIANLPEDELLKCVLQTPEGRDAFSGAAVSARAIVCRACCGGVRVENMRLVAAGKNGIDLDRFIREGQKP